MRGEVDWSWGPFFPTNGPNGQSILGLGAPACTGRCCQGTLSLGGSSRKGKFMF